MIAIFLVHAAIWTQFAASHAVGHFDRHAAMQRAHDEVCENDPNPPQPVVEKIVIRETTLSEKYGLGVETGCVRDTRWFHSETDAPLNDQQKEIAAVRADARRLAPNTNWLAARNDIASATPKIRAVRTDWEKKFAASWDEDGGFWLGGRHFATEQQDPDSDFFLLGECK